MINKLQVISGKYRGKKLCIPPCSRPTQQKARAAVFNMIGEIIMTNEYAVCPPPRRKAAVLPPNSSGGDWHIWDAFAGSGAMGIEFISRFGAATAIFTDTSPEAIKCIHENTKNIDDCRIIVEHAPAIAHHSFPGKENLSIIFIDPPYSNVYLGNELVANLAKNAPTGTIVVWEAEDSPNNKDHTCPPAKPGGEALSPFEILKDKVYGRARFLIMRKI